MTRINTYNTVPANWSEDQLLLAQQMDIVTFASPSAVRIWAERAKDRLGEDRHTLPCIHNTVYINTSRIIAVFLQVRKCICVPEVVLSIADSTRAVVIGPTSKVAAEKAGFRYVYSPSVGSKVHKHSICHSMNILIYYEIITITIEVMSGISTAHTYKRTHTCLYVHA